MIVLPPQDQQFKNPRIGVGVMVLKHGRVLLGRRIYSHGLGSWTFPGGHLEYGENIEACARREVFEETGLEIGNLRRGPYTNDVFETEKRHYVTLFIIADFTAGTLQNKEPEKASGWDWFEWTQLPEPLFLPVRHLIEGGFDLLAWI